MSIVNDNDDITKIEIDLSSDVIFDLCNKIKDTDCLIPIEVTLKRREDSKKSSNGS